MPLLLSPPLPLLDLCAAGNELTQSQEARKDQQRQSKPSSAAAAKMQQQPSSQGLHSRGTVQSPSSAAQAASAGSFPGFSVLPTQQVAAAGPVGAGKPSSRRMGARPSCSPESCILQPILSQEPELPCHTLSSEAHPTKCIDSYVPQY